MAKKLMSFKTKGMNQDLSVSAFNPEFAFENMNLRLSTVEGNTMMSWVNEKGTAYITLKEWEDNTKNTSILGTPLGTAILNHQVVLFTTEKTTDKIPEGQIIPNDHIYLLKWAEGDSPTMVGKELYRGNLKFSINHPIETLVSYENELIQKVYWTDGLNQPRVINIVGDIKPSLDTQFDFIPELQLQEKVSIKKQIGGGSFPAGVIQYCFTYFNKYMQESNIFYTSPLFYVSHANRAGSPEDTSIANSFKIRVEGVDDNFDYVRIYSVQRTSLNGTPIAKRVADVSLKEDKSSANTSTGDTGNSLDVNVDDDPTEVLTDSEGNKYIEYTDTGVNGDSIDPTELLYKGGYGIIAGTIEQKDSTLFMGNLQQQSLSKYNEIKGDIEENVKIDYKIEIPAEDLEENPTIRLMTKTLKLEDSASESDYFNELNIETEYTDLTSNSTISTGHTGASCASFRNQNYYRLGVQFQDSLGVWTSPIYLKDAQIELTDSLIYWKKENNTLKNSTFYGKIPGTIAKNLYEKGYRKARAVAVMPNYEDRVVLYQGVVNPTMYNNEDRLNERTYSQPSWFFRPLSHAKYVEAIYYEGSIYTWPISVWEGENRDIETLYTESIKHKSLQSSIKNMPLYSPEPLFAKWVDLINSYELGVPRPPYSLMQDYEIQSDDGYSADWNTVTFHSPDLEFDSENVHIDSPDLYFSSVGLAQFDHTYGNIDIQTETPTKGKESKGADRYNNSIIKGIESCGVGSGLWYEDCGVEDNDGDNWADFHHIIDAGSGDNCVASWLVYPWQRDGSLNNDINRPDGKGVQTAKLKKKVIANLRYANSIFKSIEDESIREFERNPVFFSSDQTIIEKLGSDGKIYQGNINTVLNSDKRFGNFCGNLYDTNIEHFSSIASQSYLEIRALVWNIDSWANHSWLDPGMHYHEDLKSIPTGITMINPYKSPYNADFINALYELGNKINTWLGSQDALVNVLPDNVKTDLRKIINELNTSNLEYSYIEATFYIKNNNNEAINITSIKFTIDNILQYSTTYLNYWGLIGFWNSENNRVLGYATINQTTWNQEGCDVGQFTEDTLARKALVRMKYKSSPHIVFSAKSYIKEINNENSNILWSFYKDGDDYSEILSLPIVNIQRKIDTSTIFGGQSEDALKANIWVPCGEPVNLPSTETDTYFYYLYGDTYYQRYDCLKTYPFTPEDVNQIVEIGSFMLESYVNIDGRYDRNRGQANNLNMTPQNFNLLNPVYSQRDNFFTYRIQEDDYYKNKEYPNQITWSKTKASGDETDMWTNVTMANTLEMDGDKGEVNKLIRLNDQLLCFQDTGISQILYNDNVQIASTTGVPIEIANSQKVQGKRYLSNTIGCSNKWSMVSTPAGIYFMDNVNKSIMMFNGQLNNLSQTGGFNSWCKKNILNTKGMWTPTDFNNDFVSYYDTINQDILFIGGDRALAFSEKFGTFTSFYDYGNTPYFCNLDGKGIWFKSINDTTTDLWQHQAGEYCEFFSTPDNSNYCSYWMTLVGNPEPQTDKIFTNLEFRASIIGDGTPSEEKDTDGNPIKFTPSLPFDSLEVWDEYQHGYASLENLTGHSAYTHGNESSSLKRKFRMWRCDIPRNNCLLDDERPTPDTLAYSKDSDLSISRHIRKPMDRMRNPWLYLKLTKKTDGNNSYRTELHDFVMTYFN